MTSRIVPRALFASALAVASYLALPSARPPTCTPYYQPTEYSVGTPYPVDVAVTTNGRRSAVRSAITTAGSVSTPYANGITIWDLTTATPPVGPFASFAASGEGTTFGVNGYEPSDRIELTNTRGIATGSGISPFAVTGQDTTYIDVFNAGLTPSLLMSYVIAPSSALAPPSDAAGYTNDVEISPDGAFGIVNAANWIFIVEMGMPTLANITAFNIGAPPYGPQSPSTNTTLCTPNHAVDSIAVSDDRAVVTTARFEMSGGLGGWVTWVYIIDLTTKLIVLEQRVPPPGEVDEVGAAPHDVAITRNGEMAVVTMHRMIALFDLVTNTMLASYWDWNSSRKYQRQVDSVELTNDSAVVIADNTSAGAGLPFWQVEVFQINRTAPPYLSLPVTYIDSNSPSGTPSRSHDLEIAPGDTRALVRTSFENVIITSLASPTPSTLNVLTSPNGSNAYAYEPFGVAVNYTQFSSDAVTIGPLVAGPTPYQIAVTIGGSLNAQGVYQGHVDFIDLAATTPSVAQTSIVSSSTSYGGCVPLDLVLIRDREEVVVRSADPFADAPTTLGVDVVFFSLISHNPVANFGGTGHVVGLDSLALGVNGVAPPNARKRITSISEDIVNVLGRVHVVDD